MHVTHTGQLCNLPFHRMQCSVRYWPTRSYAHRSPLICTPLAVVRSGQLALMHTTTSCYMHTGHLLYARKHWLLYMHTTTGELDICTSILALIHTTTGCYAHYAHWSLPLALIYAHHHWHTLVSPAISCPLRVYQWKLCKVCPV